MATRTFSLRGGNSYPLKSSNFSPKPRGFFFQNPSSCLINSISNPKALQQVAFHTREHLFLIMNKIVAGLLISSINNTIHELFLLNLPGGLGIKMLFRVWSSVAQLKLATAYEASRIFRNACFFVLFLFQTQRPFNITHANIRFYSWTKYVVALNCQVY